MLLTVLGAGAAAAEGATASGIAPALTDGTAVQRKDAGRGSVTINADSSSQFQEQQQAGEDVGTPVKGAGSIEQQLRRFYPGLSTGLLSRIW